MQCPQVWKNRWKPDPPAAIWLGWKTIERVAGGRIIRADLAEIAHARYEILSAEGWGLPSLPRQI